MIHLQGGRGTIESEVKADTDWLQDCLYDVRYDHWVMVDGKNSQVVIREGVAGDKQATTLALDPEWRLYEILPVY
jgi:hypothetical protein